MLYYLPKAVSDPVIQLHIPKQVIDQYHDNNHHMQIDKTYDTIKTNYYWPNIYKTYINI